MAQLAVDGFGRGGQPPLLVGPLKALPPAAVMMQQDIAAEIDEGGEGEDVFKAATAVTLKDAVEKGRLQDKGPQRQRGIGQGQAVERFSSVGVQRCLLTSGNDHRRPPC
jgi:hypothetical protein